MVSLPSLSFTYLNIRYVYLFVCFTFFTVCSLARRLTPGKTSFPFLCDNCLIHRRYSRITTNFLEKKIQLHFPDHTFGILMPKSSGGTRQCIGISLIRMARHVWLSCKIRTLNLLCIYADVSGTTEQKYLRVSAYAFLEGKLVAQLRTSRTQDINESYSTL